MGLCKKQVNGSERFYIGTPSQLTPALIQDHLKDCVALGLMYDDDDDDDDE